MCFPGAISHVSVKPASIRSSEMFRPVKSQVPRLFVRIEFRFQYFHGQPVQTAVSPCLQVIDPQQSFARTLFGFAIACKSARSSTEAYGTRWQPEIQPAG